MAPRMLWITEQGPTFLVRGNARQVLSEGGFRTPYVGTVRGWIFDAHRLPDLMAYLDAHRVRYSVTGAGDAL